MPSIYSPMYVEVQSDGTFRPPPYPMRFDMVAHEIKANLGCVLPNGKVNPAATSITWTPVGQRFGNFMVCGLDVADPTWFAKFKAAHDAEEPVLDSMNTAPSVQALRGRCQALLQPIRNYLDGLGVDPAPSDIERSVNGLLKLDLTAHHPRFEDIRHSYIDALSTVIAPGSGMRHWWLWKFLLEDKLDEHNNAVDTVSIMAMRDCMTTHGSQGACKAIHYIYQLGVLATYLSTV